MSDDVYHADGDDDISRYLMQTPPPESHVLALPAPDGGEPVATHVWAPTQQVPPVVQGDVAAFGHEVEDHHAMMTMDVDVQPPPTQGQYGFPAADPVPASLDDDLPSFEATLEDSVLQGLLGTLSLNDDDHSMDDGDDDSLEEALLKSLEDAGGGNTDSSAVAVAQHSDVLFPVQEGLFFVPFVPGQLDCSRCRTVREVLHGSVNHKLYFVVHVGETGIFQHAIIDRGYIDATNGQTILNELFYVDLRERTHECAQNFIANYVEMLKNDTSGQLKDSCRSTSQENNGVDKHIELEMEMLKEILSAPSSNTEAVGVPQSGTNKAPHQTFTRAEENTNAADDSTALTAPNWPMFPTAILESSQVSVQDGMPTSSNDNASATGYETQLAKQRRRIAQLTMTDIASLMHLSKKDAAKKLNISVTTLKRLCRKNNTDRWPARKINSLDSKIKKLKQAAFANAGTIGLLAIKEKMEMLEYEKALVYASVWNVIQENQKHNDGAGGSSG